MDWKGLTSDAVRRTREEEGENVLPHERTRSPFFRFLSLLSEPMLLILLAGGLLYFLMGDRTEGIILLLFVFVVLGMAFLQREKSESALNALRQMAVRHATVIRDSHKVVVSAKEVVRGDVLVLSEGDRVPADARLLEGRLFVDESVLTGESVPVLKIPGFDSLSFARIGEQTSPFVFGGTTLTQGGGVARVERTGERSAIGMIGRSLTTGKIRTSPMEQAALRFVRRFSIVGFFLASLDVLLFKMVADRNLLESLLGGLAFMMAILPEEIPVILTVFFSLGARRLSKVGVLARRISAVETLGAITILAVDKTGTLTENRMDLVALDVEGMRYRADEKKDLPEAFHRLVEFALLATPPTSADPMEKALLNFGAGHLSGTEHLHSEWNAVKVYGLEPPILAMARAFDSPDGSAPIFATKGSPESVLDLCHLPPEELAIVEGRVDRLASHGYRVLGVAWARAQTNIFPERLHDVPFSFLGLLAFQDPPRPEVRESIRDCQKAGIRVVMMTGDHPETARAIARQVGITDEEVLTGADLDPSKGTVPERMSRVSVWARLLPEQKLRLVELLRDEGECVAMTGDGVNDAPALKAAHVGVAMGLHGTDTARESASLVLLKDSFVDLVEAIRIGRMIGDNVISAVRFAVSVHIPLVVLGLSAIMTKGPMILTPVDIVLLQFIIDPACSLLFEGEPPRSNIMETPPRPEGWTPFVWKALRGSVFQGVGVSLIFFTALFFFLTLKWPPETLRTVLFVALVLNILLMILTNRSGGLSGAGRVWSDNPVAIRLFLAVPLFLLLLYSIPVSRKSLGWGTINDPGHAFGVLGLVGATVLFLIGFASLYRHWNSEKRSS